MNSNMKVSTHSCARKLLIAAALACAAFAQAGHTQAQAPSVPAVAPDFPRKVETYLRELFAWGPAVAVKVGNPSAAPMPGLLQVTIEVTSGGQSNTGLVYATPDAKFIVRGDIHDTASDPFAANRARIKTEGAASKGPANAPITVVEYADFQCPSCKQLSEILKQVLPRYPQVRVVYKDLPLAQIHPWAMTAATAGRCALKQSPEAFWKMHDAFFANQEKITPADAWTTSLGYAKQLGLDEAAFKVCMTSTEAKTEIEASVNEARALNIGNTPTTFINGRRLVGPDAETLQQFIQYELSKLRPAPPSAPKQ